MATRHVWMTAVLTAALLSACSDDGGTLVTGDPDDPTDSRLRQFISQEAFYAAVEQALIRNPFGGGSYGTVTEESNVAGGGTTDGGADAGTGGAGTTGGTDGAGTSAPDSNSDSSESSSSAPDVTGTNVQEVGVDESDRVKTTSDGQYLFVLQTNFSSVQPVPGPVPEPLPTDQASSTQPVQYDGTTLRVLSLDSSAPDATPISNVRFDFGGRLTDGMYLHETAGSNALILTSSGGGYYGYWDDSYQFAEAQTIITRADVTDPANLTVTDNIVLDGTIVSSRRIGDYLYFASRYYPHVPGADPYTMSAEDYRAAIESADIASLMPSYSSETSGEGVSLVDPANCFVARTTSNSDPYYSPDIITLGVVDLNSMQLTDTECFLGSTDTLYASPNAVFLATSQWGYYEDDGVPVDSDDGVVSSSQPLVQTDIHQFGINGGGISYAGSGVVPGHLGWNPNRRPFRMSEQNGYLRVATYSGDQGGGVSPVNLTILEAGSDGRLHAVGQLPNTQRPEHIGKPGELLYASRFLGNKAYLVTFRQTDPLYVVDLGDPSDPYLAGELEIEGFSDYLHPIDEDYLLGIGKDAIPAEDGWGDGNGGIEQGIKLALYNVSNPREPREVQSLIVGQRGTYAEALYNHRGITVQRANDQRPTRVAFGIDVAGEQSPTRPQSVQEAWQWYEWNYTGLHGFEIRTGTDAGIVNTGVMKVESRNYGAGYYYPLWGEDRSVIVDDSVFYIHGPEVYASRWNNMDNYLGPR
ncbi:MAG: beta-propeller domain-containing protein [Gammaproteobacteria bacterium]|nr:beta-propeller domain-containing protein [Gammaproteobacteria bacterium]